MPETPLVVVLQCYLGMCRLTSCTGKIYYQLPWIPPICLDRSQPRVQENPVKLRLGSCV